MARRAMELAFNDACTIGFAAISIAHLEVNAKTGLDFAKRALDINAYSPLAKLAAALMHHYCGNYDESIKHLDHLADCGVEPLKFWADACYALNYYQLDRLDEAITAARRAVQSNPGMVLSWRVLVVSLARANQLQEARELARKLVQLDATEYIQYFERFSLYTEPRALNRLLMDLQKAGVPYSRSQEMEPQMTQSAADYSDQAWL